ncbi:unnamed protein product, partial [Medioppia subpectinata]
MSLITESMATTEEEKKRYLQRCDSLPNDFNHNKEAMAENNNKYSHTIHLCPNDIYKSDEELNGKKSLKSLNGYQILILILLSYGNFWVAACVSLQAPFFPKEAESKGATPTQYGFVFGVYELMIAVTSPLFGKMIASVSPILFCELGLFISGISTVLFGLLDRLEIGNDFIIMCFVVRIIEGVSSAAFMTASYAIMTKEFPDRIATTFSLLQTFFGLGLILGPTLGGALYQWGGFILPFVVLGSFLLLGGVFTFLLLETCDKPPEQESGNFIAFMSDSGVLLDALAIATSLNFIGFNAATLEPHLRQFNLRPIDPKKLCLFGCLLSIVGYVYIGPQEFIEFEPQLWLITLSLVFIGFGLASKLVTAFISALNDAIHRRGFPDNISTYGLVSAMYFSANSMGAFIGPTLGGYLIETVGYRSGTFVILMIDVILTKVGKTKLLQKYCIARKALN